MGPLGQEVVGGCMQGCAWSGRGAGMQAQRPSGNGDTAGISQIPWGCLWQESCEWNSFSLGREVRRALPPGGGEAAAEAKHGQPNHRLCDSKPEPFSVSCFLTGMAGGDEIRKLRN